MLKPLEDHVILTSVKEDKTTASGIILVTDDKEKPSLAKVVAIGPKVENIQTGDTVIYQQYTGTKVTYEEQDYIIVQAKNILAIVE